MIMTSLVVFIFAFAALAAALVIGEQINVELSVDHSNFFDNIYRTFSKQKAGQLLFGYNNDTACSAERGDNNGRYAFDSWSISLQQINSLQRTHAVSYYVPSIGESVPRACFDYRSYSFVFIEDNSGGRNELRIYRGQQLKVVKNFTRHGRVLYDHIAGRLLLIDRQEKRISELDMDSLNAWWTSKEQQSMSRIIKVIFIGYLPWKQDDLMVVDNWVYTIKDRRMYKFYIGNEATTVNFITNTSDTRFNFLLFKANNDDVINITTNDNYRKLSESTAFNFWLYLMYLVDALLIIICAIALKQLRSINNNNNNNRRRSDSNSINSQESNFWKEFAKGYKTIPQQPPLVLKSFTSNDGAVNSSSKE